MKNLKLIALFLLSSIIVFQFSSCGGGKTSAKPVSEILRTVFFAKQVKHDNTVVYSKGAVSNTVSGYSKFKLDLSSSSSVIFTDFDGNTFTGNYSLLSDNKTLTLTGLNPVPTGSGGTITFSIISFQESPAQVVLSRSGASVKTGNTVNEYTLVTTP
jgi:hypothetical protein